MTFYNGPIVDAHMHLWDLDSEPFGNTYGWLLGPKAIQSHLAGSGERLQKMQTTYLLNDYEEDAKNLNIVKTVHVQAECDNSRGETEWLQNIADNHGKPQGIVAHCNLAKEDVEDNLKFHCQFHNVKGIRQLLNFEDKNSNLNFCDRGDYLTDPNFLRGFALLEKYHLSFDLHVWYHQMKDVATLADRFPNIQIIVDHLGCPKGYLDPSLDSKKGWKEAMELMSKRPNVAVKLSGLWMTLQPEEFEEYLHYVIGIFGVNRCIFASNCPVDKMNAKTLENLVNEYKRSLRNFSFEEQKKFFHDNAIQFYRLQ